MEFFDLRNTRPLTFSDIFHDKYEFAFKVQEVGGVTELDTLYNILAMRYFTSTTMYMIEEPFIMGIKRKLNSAYPAYLRKKEMYQEILNLEIADIMRQSKRTNQGSSTGSSTVEANSNNIRNEVENMDTPVTNADTIAVKDLSTKQTSDRLEADNGTEFNNQDNFEETVDTNRLDAIMRKFEAIDQNLVAPIYSAIDPLFKGIL